MRSRISVEVPRTKGELKLSPGRRWEEQDFPPLRCQGVERSGPV